MKRNRNYDKYLEIMDKHINVNWNFKDVYEKIVDGIISEHEKEKIQPPIADQSKDCI
nr:hypothetical protein [Sedimentibacter sp.]